MSLMDEFKKIIHPYDDEDYDYENEDQFPTQRPGKESAFDDRKDDRRSDDRRNKVVNIHATTQLKVVLVKPERFENASEIADHLRNKRTVVLNLEQTDKNIARRLIDFLKINIHFSKLHCVHSAAYIHPDHIRNRLINYCHRGSDGAALA